jgi:hypothetical protein
MPRHHRRLPNRAHRAVLGAATHPDRQIPESTPRPDLLRLEEHKLACVRPILGTRWGVASLDTPRMWLTSRGRAYAQTHGVSAPPRRVVAVVHLQPDGAPPGAEAYGRACHTAAETLVRGRGQIARLCPGAGLQPLDRPVGRRVARNGPPVTVSKFRQQVQTAGLDDAEVVFLGAGVFADLVRQVLPDAYLPLAARGGPREQMEFCDRLLLDGEARGGVWAEAARRRERRSPRWPCEVCGWAHGRIDVADLERGDVFAAGQVVLKVREASATWSGQLVHTWPTLRRPLLLPPEAGIDVSRRSRGAAGGPEAPSPRPCAKGRRLDGAVLRPAPLG